jgi:hypothetical protein
MTVGTIRVWRLISHHAARDEACRWFSESGLIAIGWGKIGDLSQGTLTSSTEIFDAIRHTYPDLQNAGSGGPCLTKFRDHVSPGDLVIISDGGRRRSVMEVSGQYRHERQLLPAPIGDYQHQRDATVVAIDADSLWAEAGGSAKAGQNIRWTLVECAKPINQAIKEQLIGQTKCLIHSRTVRMPRKSVRSSARVAPAPLPAKARSLIHRLHGSLSHDLRHPAYPVDPSELYWATLGHCYIATEAIYHLWAKEAGYVPFVLKHQNGSHWWLVHGETGQVLDPTEPQLDGGPFPYDEGHKQAFLTVAPSRRAQELIRRMLR